jgi:hypothetical protein
MAKKNSTKIKRAKRVAEGIRLAWSSLDSHLDWTHGKATSKGETPKFHQKCVQEYAQLIKLLADLY